MRQHNIIKQCVFVHVGLENITMAGPNLVQGESYWVLINSRLGHPIVILSNSTWTNAHTLLSNAMNHFDAHIYTHKWGLLVLFYFIGKRPNCEWVMKWALPGGRALISHHTTLPRVLGTSEGGNICQRYDIFMGVHSISTYNTRQGKGLGLTIASARWLILNLNQH